jgi:hypothetical protein
LFVVLFDTLPGTFYNFVRRPIPRRTVAESPRIVQQIPGSRTRSRHPQEGCIQPELSTHVLEEIRPVYFWQQRLLPYSPPRSWAR